MSKELTYNVMNRKPYFLLLVFLFFGLGANSSFGQNCKAELSVEKNRSVRSAAENGAVFYLVLNNTSSRTTSFDLSTINTGKTCTPVNRSSTGANVALDTQILGNNGLAQQTGRISVGAGQSHSFQVKVMAPKGTPFQTWGCIEVQARSESCNEIISTILSVYVPDPSKG